MPRKKCKTCGQTKDLHKDFTIREGRKRHDDCEECRKLKKAGLNPTPQVVKRESVDADRARRKEQYRKSIQRLKSGMNT